MTLHEAVVNINMITWQLTISPSSIGLAQLETANIGTANFCTPWMRGHCGVVSLRHDPHIRTALERAGGSSGNSFRANPPLPYKGLMQMHPSL